MSVTGKNQPRKETNKFAKVLFIGGHGIHVLFACEEAAEGHYEEG